MEKWINCKHCGHYYSNKLRRCPECGSITPPGVKQIASAAVIVAAVAVAGVGFFLGINDKGNNISQPPESSDVSVLSSEQSGLPPETDSGTDSVLSSESLSPSQPDSPTESKNPAPEIKKENSEKSTGAEKTESAVSKPSPPKPPESSTLPETVPSGDEVEDIDAADREEIMTEPGETCVDLTYSVELADLLRELSDTPLTELTEEDKENGIVSVTENPDGTLTIRFTEQGFENYKADIRGEILLDIDEIKAAANSQTAFIDDIVCNDDFSDMDIRINAENYDPEISSGALEEVIYSCWSYAFVYNLFIGESEKNVALTVTDTAGETLYDYS